MDELRRMAEHSSERERAAMKCEREVNALYACLLMEDRVGEEFAATVSSLADFGFFVELDAEHVEGLVRADDLGPGTAWRWARWSGRAGAGCRWVRR
jgi:ribonuclease R